MSNEIQKGKLFIAQVVAKLKGDDAEAKAAKNARKALSAVEGQLAALRAREVDLENNVEDANEALNNAKFPTELITSNTYYIASIQKAQSAYDTAVSSLDEVKESIVYFEKLLKTF